MTDDEVTLLLLTDSPDSLLTAYGYHDFAAYAQVLLHNEIFTKAREHLPTLMRWSLGNSTCKPCNDHRNTIAGNMLRVRLLQELNAQPRDLVATDSALTRLRAAASATRGTRPDTAMIENQLAVALSDTEWLCDALPLRLFLFRVERACETHRSVAGRGWAHIAELYAHPNAHLRLMHMLTHKTTKGRPRLD